jgi:uncharacterized coiled-coil protein SlyX
VDTDERLSRLESRLAEHDDLIAKLIVYAQLTPAGRMILKILGVKA